MTNKINPQTVKAVLEKCCELRGSADTDEDGFFQAVFDVITQQAELISDLTKGEETEYVRLDDNEDKIFLVPESILTHIEQVGMNWKKDRDKNKIFELEIKELQEELTATTQVFGMLLEHYMNDIRRLKEILFCCGEVAVSEFNDTVVGLVDKTLKGFSISKERCIELQKEILKDSRQSS